MQKLIIMGGTEYDGEYDMPMGLTARELHFVRQVSGVRAGELDEAGMAGDIAVLIAFTAIALERTGKVKQVNMEALWAMTDDNFDLTAPEKTSGEDEGRPPDSATHGGNENEPGVSESETENEPSSGSNGSHDGEISPPIPLRTGDLGSETTAESSPETDQEVAQT